jgi:hypothetical protein
VKHSRRLCQNGDRRAHATVLGLHKTRVEPNFLSPYMYQQLFH